MSGAAEPGDLFGFRVATADNHVAISSIGEAVGTRSRAGMVHVFAFDFETGELTQLDAVHQDSPGISGTAETGDHFGRGLSIAPYRPTANSPVMPLVSIGRSPPWTRGRRVCPARSTARTSSASTRCWR